MKPDCSKCLIEYKDVTLSYGYLDVIKHASFTVHQNDFLNIVGPNGAGKTTLIKSLIHQIKPKHGDIIMQDLKMGYVPQKLTIKRNIPLTVLEFIYTGFTKQSLIISKTDKALILDWLIKMKLDKSLLNEKVSHLSGGQLQRIYLIRSLISNPEVLILDEPASALDPNFREYFYELIKDIRRNNNLTIIHITHDLTDVILENSLVMYVDQEIKFFGTYIDYNKFEHEGHHHD